LKSVVSGPFKVGYVTDVEGDCVFWKRYIREVCSTEHGFLWALVVVLLSFSHRATPPQLLSSPLVLVVIRERILCASTQSWVLEEGDGPDAPPNLKDGCYFVFGGDAVDKVSRATAALALRGVSMPLRREATTCPSSATFSPSRYAHAGGGGGREGAVTDASTRRE
jgi:hypothetical protein